MTTRFALYSDVHANLGALLAVYADMDARAIERRYCLGDLVGYGHDPGAVIAAVRASGDAVLRGNYDDGIGFSRGDCGCYYPTPEDRMRGAESYDRTDSSVSDADRAWLASLPETLRFEVEGLRVVLAHGSPRKINEYLLPDRTDEFLGRLAQQAEADLLCVGHVHIPYHRVVTTPTGAMAHWVSDGSVGKPKDGDSRACWAEVVIDGDAPEDERVSTVFYRVEFDGERL